MPTNWNSIWHMTYLVWQSIMAYYLTYILTFYLTYILTFYLAFDLTYILTFYLAFDMRYILTFYQAFYHIFFVTSCTRNWGPAVPVEIWLLQLRSGSTPLSSGPRGWGPAVPTEIGALAVEVRQRPLTFWRSRLRSGSAHWETDIWCSRLRSRSAASSSGLSPRLPKEKEEKEGGSNSAKI